MPGDGRTDCWSQRGQEQEPEEPETLTAATTTSRRFIYSIFLWKPYLEPSNDNLTLIHVS